MNTAQLSHIKKSVLGPEAFDSFISAWIPEGPERSCFHSARLFWREKGRQAGLSQQLYEACGSKGWRVHNNSHHHSLLTPPPPKSNMQTTKFNLSSSAVCHVVAWNTRRGMTAHSNECLKVCICLTYSVVVSHEYLTTIPPVLCQFSPVCD